MTEKTPQTPEEKIAFALKLKEEGNTFFKNGEFRKAASKYSHIFAYIEGLNPNISSLLASGVGASAPSTPQSPLDKQITELRIVARSNMCACFLKLEKYDKAIQNADLALKQDPNNIKVLFRRGQAYLASGDLDRAKSDLDTVSRKQPDDPAVKAELHKLRQAFSAHAKKEKGLYSKMFAKMSEEQ